MLSLASLFGLKSKGFHTDIIPDPVETPKDADSLKQDQPKPQTAAAPRTDSVTTKRPSSPTPSPRGYA